jgi:hypothetical protein
LIAKVPALGLMEQGKLWAKFKHVIDGQAELYFALGLNMKRLLL